MIGKLLNSQLIEIENQIWDFESKNGGKPEYSMEGFRAIIKIFSSGILDKMWEFQENKNMNLIEKRKMILNFSNELNDIIKKYTDIETKKLYENF